MLTPRSINRRELLQAGSAVAVGMFVAPAAARPLAANEQVNLAGVGVGGKGWSDINSTSAGHNVVAFCDVDTKGSRRGGYGAAAEKWPKARRFTDYRRMLDEMHGQIDGITVSTPDHMHAPITMAAIELGIATYTQKPLSRTVHEARQLARAAARKGVVTQMGNQGHSSVAYRQLVQLLGQGTIGRIREAHAWSNRPIWPQGLRRPQGSDPVPENLNWDLWLGVAAERPYVKDVYHPFKWRGWFDFGAGALGDMGCHIIDPVVWGLELGPPLSVRYEGPEPNPDTFPEWEILHYRFPATRHTVGDDPIDVTWYDGGKLPDASLAPLPAGEELPKNGTLFIGEKGVLLTRHGGMPQLLPQEKFKDTELPVLEPVDHYLQWTNAIRGEGQTTAGFDYSGPLTETVLLGTIAARYPQQSLEWDSEGLRFTNAKAANAWIRQEYRNGWQVEGL